MEDIGSANRDAGLGRRLPDRHRRDPADHRHHRAPTGRRPGSAGQPEPGDRFGAALAGSKTTVLVGVPGEDVGTTKDAGQFYSVVGRGRQRLHARVPAGVPDRSRPATSSAPASRCCPAAWPGCRGVGDRFAVRERRRGRGCRDRDPHGPGHRHRARARSRGSAASPSSRRPTTASASGCSPAPSDQPLNPPSWPSGSRTRTSASLTDAGRGDHARHVPRRRHSPRRRSSWWSQNTDGIETDPKAGELFGSSLGAVLLRKGRSRREPSILRLLIGVPGEDEVTPNGPLINSGMVAILPSRPRRVHGHRAAC